MRQKKTGSTKGKSSLPATEKATTAAEDSSTLLTDLDVLISALDHSSPAIESPPDSDNANEESSASEVPASKPIPEITVEQDEALDIPVLTRQLDPVQLQALVLQSLSDSEKSELIESLVQSVLPELEERLRQRLREWVKTASR